MQGAGLSAHLESRPRCRLWADAAGRSLGVPQEGSEVREALCKSKQVLMKLSR